MSAKDKTVRLTCLLVAALVLSLVANVCFVVNDYSEQPDRERALDIINLANGTLKPRAGPSSREIKWMRDYCGGRDEVRSMLWRGDAYPVRFTCDDFRDAYIPRDL